MDRKEVKKAIRGALDSFLRESGFQRRSGQVFIKINENILHIITFEFGSIGFTCTVAMQPLYIKEYAPSASFHLTFGSRLSRFKVVQKEWWSYEEPMKGISEIKKLLVKNGLPWFDRFGTPKGIVDFISNHKIEEYRIWFSKFHQCQYLGFSLLYIGRVEEGLQALQAMLDEISESAVESMKEYKMQITNFIEWAKENPKDISKAFDNIVQENKVLLKM